MMFKQVLFDDFDLMLLSSLQISTRLNFQIVQNEDYLNAADNSIIRRTGQLFEQNARY